MYTVFIKFTEQSLVLLVYLGIRGSNEGLLAITCEADLDLVDVPCTKLRVLVFTLSNSAR